MRTVLYVLLPAGAFGLILGNALYGHLLFDSDVEVANRYVIYVHLQPDWKSHPKNIIYDVTTVWFREENGTGGTTYNPNELLEAGGKQFVELRHGYSECRDKWQPVLYGRAIEALRDSAEKLAGKRLYAEPGRISYPDVADPQRQYGITDGYAQLVPLCTSREGTTYDYSIRTDDVGFDVYFVDSSVRYGGFYGSDFEYNMGTGCHAAARISYTGSCAVSSGEAMLVVIPDRLDSPTGRITINLYERPYP